jgi:hypothetical protein
MSKFQQVLQRARESRKSAFHGIPFQFSGKLGGQINGIRQGTYYIVSGMQSSGKKSFTDLNFVFSALWWYACVPEESRPPMKIIYFNMDKSEKVKPAKWMCLYMYACYGKLIDINTIDGDYNRLYDLDSQTIQELETAALFFDEMIRKGVLEIHDGAKSPSKVHEIVERSMLNFGGIHTEHDGEKRYELSPQYKNLQMIVVVDNASKLKLESQNKVTFADNDIHKRMHESMMFFKEYYKIAAVMIVPSFKVGGVFKQSQMTPDFREFGLYYEGCDVALHLFNPFKCQINDWVGFTVADFITEPDKIPRLRFCTIMRNTEGLDSSMIPLVFHPEAGFMFDCPLPTDVNYQQTIFYYKNYKQEQIYGNQQSFNSERALTDSTVSNTPSTTITIDGTTLQPINEYSE